VYAVSLLSSSNEINEGMWNKVASEFYHCPYFRSQHAYWLFEQKENLKGLAELTAITIDFPWYKDAVINTKQAILQFREQANSNDMWEGELLHVNELIETNNWT
jgi:hypothetical protein